MVQASEPAVSIPALEACIRDPASPLTHKYRALFALRNCPGSAAESALTKGLQVNSALFRHEVAYCLGQRQDPSATALLSEMLRDTAEHPMVRHEAGEALGAIGTPACLEQLQRHEQDTCLEVAQTCQLALQRIDFHTRRAARARHTATPESKPGAMQPQNATNTAAAPVCSEAVNCSRSRVGMQLPADSNGSTTSSHEQSAQTASVNQHAGPSASCEQCQPLSSVAVRLDPLDEADEEPSRFMSVDPTPAAPSATPMSQLRATLLDEHAAIFDRYAAMFALRNRGGPKAVAALQAVMAASDSALLKHEVAYVLGQMGDAQASSCLGRVLRDEQEHAMVRHEAAEALGAIADPSSLHLLTQHCADPEPIVADSCKVALDMLEFEQSGGFEYLSVPVAAS
ncbi:hypothetical protein WJX74_007727 [Apatococcus lobatus]|uniref:Deoxyhypusine hydroxylase n=1 Tax=Apatococcus lobatus TaxID=904363 RepID=A0AAW1S3X8_9CHLO